jgi:hypothetical protein
LSNALVIAGSEVAIAGMALWGWGRVIRGLAGGRPLSAPLTIALGLGGVIFLGGVLNALGLAYPAALNAMILAGLAAVVPKLVKRGARGPGGSRANPGGGWALVPILVAGWFLAAHLVPQQSYNIYDDFEKYFAYPVKMLATGTLGGNRLSAIGGETLGGQAFLQGFVLAHLPPAYIGTMDTCLGLLLCVALAGFAVAPGAGVGVALAAEVSVLVLNPEIININSVFTGAALIMAAVFLSGEGEEAGRPVPAAWLGLLYAGLIALKTTFLLFVVIHPLLLALTRAGVERRGGAGWRAALNSLMWTGVFLSPWIILSASHYWAAWHAATISMAASGQEVFSLLSMRPELYGGTQAGHTALAVAALLVALVGLGAAWFGWLLPSPTLASAIAALATTGIAYFVLVLGLNPYFGHEGATRYGCPIVIGTIPAAMRLWGGLDWKSGVRRLAPIGLLGLAVATFLPCAVARIRQVARYETPLAFSPSVSAPAFIAYNQEVLSGGARKRLAAVQQWVPPHALILAWVSNPFWLDFKRNVVVETNPAGVGSRWAWPPVANYFLWEYRGYAVKYPGFVTWTPADYAKIFYGECTIDRINSVRALGFAIYLEDHAKQAELLYNDGSLMLFRMHP